MILCAYAGSQPNDLEYVGFKFVDLAPKRDLPVISYVPWAIERLERSSSTKSLTKLQRYHLEKSATGWISDAKPNARMRSYDNYVLEIGTNDPPRLRKDVRAIFRTIGFLPDDPYSSYHRAGQVELEIKFFDELVFVYGGPLPIIVLAQTQDDGPYAFRSSTASSEGHVVRKTLGHRHLYVFQEDHRMVLLKMRREYPIARVLLLWDDSGRKALDTGYDHIEWANDHVTIHRNTEALAAPCGVGSSSFNCRTSGNACQLSLLDPVHREPAVLTMALTVAYVDDKLQPTGVEIGMVPVAAQREGGITCQEFPAVDDILSFKEFGVCGRNLKGVVDWRCLGNAGDYLKESWEASKLYWLGLGAFLEHWKGCVPVTVDPDLKKVLTTLRNTRGGSQVDKRRIPHGVGYSRPWDLLRAVMCHQDPSAAPAPARPAPKAARRSEAAAQTTPAAGAGRTWSFPVQAVEDAEFLKADGTPITDIQVMLQPNLIRLRVSAEDAGPERTYDIVFLKRGKEVSRHALTALRKDGVQAPGGKAVYEALFYLTVPHLPGNEACDPSIPKLMSPGGLIDIVATDPASGRYTPKIGR